MVSKTKVAVVALVALSQMLGTVPGAVVEEKQSLGVPVIQQILLRQRGRRHLPIFAKKVDVFVVEKNRPCRA